MGKKKLELVGIKFGKLTVLKDSTKRYNGGIVWECLCDCGRKLEVTGNRLISNNTKSCGCLKKEATTKRNTKHGNAAGRKTKEYVAWLAMKQRCGYIGHIAYKHYGGRGIKVCDRWINSFDNFLQDMGESPSRSHSLDRYPDTNGDYELNNCRWGTDEQQGNNTRRNVFYECAGRRMTIAQWAREIGITSSALYHHLVYNGKTIFEVKNMKRKRSLIRVNHSFGVINQ